MYIKQNSKLTEGYKKLLLGFVIVTVILIIVVLYFSASRAVISVKASSTKVSTDFVSDIATDGGLSYPDMIQGVLFETEIEDSVVEKSTGSVVLEGDSIGKVTLINTRDEEQVLVKTTRLLTPDNILLRLSERVTIPAGSEIEANVYADDADAFTKLDPTTFIIPGLWEGLQDKVYAKSTNILQNSGDIVKSIDEIDLTKAKETVNRQIVELANTEFRTTLPNQEYKILVVSKKILSESSEGQVGDHLNEFKLTMKMKLVLLGIDNEDILKLGGDRLTQVVSEDRELVNLNLNNFTYNIQNYDDNDKTVTLKVHIEGDAVIKSDSPIFDRSKLAGLSPKGVELYLANFNEIESAIVELSPFWVKKVPRLKDHIDIVIVE
jgi:hypothetical protein